jgi:hypothetical protein
MSIDIDKLEALTYARRQAWEKFQRALGAEEVVLVPDLADIGPRSPARRARDDPARHRLVERDILRRVAHPSIIRTRLEKQP